MLHLARLAEEFFCGAALILGQVCQPLYSRQANISEGLLAPALQYSATTHLLGHYSLPPIALQSGTPSPKDVIVSQSPEGACPKILQGARMYRTLPISGPCSCTRTGREDSACGSTLGHALHSLPGMFRVSDKAGPFYHPLRNSWSQRWLDRKKEFICLHC
jgi:hypothetical protein